MHGYKWPIKCTRTRSDAPCSLQLLVELSNGTLFIHGLFAARVCCLYGGRALQMDAPLKERVRWMLGDEAATTTASESLSCMFLTRRMNCTRIRIVRFRPAAVQLVLIWCARPPRVTRSRRRQRLLRERRGRLGVGLQSQVDDA